MRRVLIIVVAASALPLQGAWAQAGVPGTVLRTGGQGGTINPRVLQAQSRLNPTTALPGLKIIESGYAEDNADGTRTMTFAACATNVDNGANQITGMEYALAASGKSLSGNLQPYFAPSRPQTIYNSHFQPPSQPNACRRATLTFAACSVPPGDYDLTITATVAGGFAPSAKGKSTVPANVSTISIAPPGNFQVATPRTVSGTVGGSCGLLPKQVRVYADKGSAAVVVPVGAGGQWSAPFLFRSSGSDMLHAKAEPEGKLDDAYTLVAVSVAPTPIDVTISQVPGAMPVGTVTAAVAQVVNRDTKAVLADFPLTMKLGNSQPCAAITDANGTVKCTLALPASTPVSNQVPVIVTSSGSDAITSNGTVRTVATTADGLIFHKTDGDTMVDVLAGEQPYGVLLDNYNPDWSGTGAHLDNGSINYPNTDSKGGQPFDIKTYHVTNNIVFYIDNVMVRLKPFTTAAPARLSASVYLTPGPTGRGPAIKGFCFNAACSLIGYDDSIPDITSIKVTDGSIAIDFAVVGGKVKPTLAKADATLDFTCGGISSLACGALRSVANDKIREQLKSPPMIGAMLQRVGLNMDKKFATLLPVWKIKTLTGISFDATGAMTVTGTPLTN